MQWKSKPKLKHGDKRSIKCFAFFPTELQCNTVVWLESYYKHQIFIEEFDRYGTVYYSVRYWVTEYETKDKEDE